MNPTTSRTPLFAAVAVGALALSTFNTVRLSALSAPAGLAFAALPAAASAAPVLTYETTVPPAAMVQFPADEAPAVPTF